MFLGRRLMILILCTCTTGALYVVACNITDQQSQNESSNFEATNTPEAGSHEGATPEAKKPPIQCQPTPGQPNPPNNSQKREPGKTPLNEAFTKHLKAAKGLTYQQLLQKYRKNYHQKLDFKVDQVKYYNDVLRKFPLPVSAKKQLDTLGFVITPLPKIRNIREAGPTEIYYRIFASDLPVFIGADAILHAWHRTFDTVMLSTEENVLYSFLSELLSRSIKALDGKTQAQKDALFYLSVAKSLLDKTQAPTSIYCEVQKFLGYIKSRKPLKVTFFGKKTAIDFSQFIPRGHYNKSEKMRRYFLAMMWLGKVDLVLYGEFPHPREEAAARAIASALESSGGLQLFQKLDRYYGILVGKPNAINPVKLLSLCQQAGQKNCKGTAKGMEAIYKKQPASSYSGRIHSDSTAPITMRFFPQRFVYDAWVTSQTTTPRLKPATTGGRSMAMPEEVAFALGLDRALVYMAEDMKRPYRENLPATLEAIRKTFSELKPTALGETVYNHWLEALMLVGKPTTQKNMPQVMRTATWHDRKMEVVLASWAELRHDTLLVAEQSTGGKACQYPKGYIEPLPEFYRKMQALANKMKALYKGGDYEHPTVTKCLQHWNDVLHTLAVISEKELQSKPMSKDELEFVNKTVDRHRKREYLGVRMYDGWYPKLFWFEHWGQRNGFYENPSGVSEPLVADVHTDIEHGKVLQVATGVPGLMYIAIDNEGDRALYLAPAMGFFSFHKSITQRMTDEAWRKELSRSLPYPRPPYAQQYWLK